MMSKQTSRLLAVTTTLLIGLTSLISLLQHLRPLSAQALTILTVHNTNDSGNGSLRQAILDANSIAGADMIEITAVGTVNLLSPLPTIVESVTIHGSGADSFRVDGQNAHQIFNASLSDLTLANLTIQHGNAAGASPRGGGLHSNGHVTLMNVQVLSNTAESYGGGIDVAGGLLVVDTLLQNNRSLSGVGGAMFAGGVTFITNTQFISNSARLSGGGLYALGELQIADGLFHSNQSLSNGGGLFSFSRTTLQNTQFLSNTAQNQGGGASAPGILTISDGLFQNNQTVVGTGGGLFGQDRTMLHNTQFLSNTAQSRGGGLYMLGAVTVTAGLFENNQSRISDGGGLFGFGPITISNTQFLRNVASAGGGIYHGFDKNGRLTNSLFADNQATSELGAALLLASSGTVELTHLTIGTATAQTGSAIALLTGTVTISNTIVVSHTVGISQVSGIVTQDYNLFFGNGLNMTGGVIDGRNSLSGAPDFQQPAADDYRLNYGSAAVDAGVDVGVKVDFEGEKRPLNNGIDIGYDEINLADFLPQKLYLPHLLR